MQSPVPIPPIAFLRRWILSLLAALAVVPALLLLGDGASASGTAPLSAAAPQGRAPAALSFVMATEAPPVEGATRPKLRLTSLRVELREIGVE